MPDSRRKALRTFAFQGESTSLPTPDSSQTQTHPVSPEKHSNKRKREDDEEEYVYDDSDSGSDFYGFAAESFIFAEEEMASEDASPIHHQIDHPADGVRRSKRTFKKKKKEDFEYY